MKLSIITVTYNCEDSIGNTYKSLNNQLKYIKLSEIEYISVDGESNDGTIDLINKEIVYLGKLGISTRFISEKDNGIFDAMNKGLSIASGEWIYMLNAGDVFYDEKVLCDVMQFLNDDSDVICGGAIRFNENFSEIWFPKRVDDLLRKMNMCHQSVFIRKNIEEHQYASEYNYCADYDLLLRLYLNNRKFSIIDRVIVYYSLDGVTANSAMLRAYDEIYKVRKNNNVIERKAIEYINHLLGRLKRYTILHMPQKTRWILKKIYSKCFSIVNHKTYEN